MKLSLDTPAVAPRFNDAFVEGALRKFCRGGLRLSVLFTGGDRQTLRFTGLIDAEARALVTLGLATMAPVDPAHRFRVKLTSAGHTRRDALARRDLASKGGRRA